MFKIRYRVSVSRSSRTYVVQYRKWWMPFHIDIPTYFTSYMDALESCRAMQDGVF